MNNVIYMIGSKAGGLFSMNKPNYLQNNDFRLCEEISLLGFVLPLSKQTGLRVKLYLVEMHSHSISARRTSSDKL